jgi:hypothetical protein
VTVSIRPVYLNALGSEPVSGAAAASRVTLKAGDEASFYGILEFREFNDGPDGNPSLAIDGYLAVWPKS